MAVIEQDYDIDLKSTGAFPVVKCSQFDTGSREIVFTVYDNWELANIDGCLARVDGTRSDGTEFSVSCTVSTGSKVSFTITQEMTKAAGKHPAELVIFDAQGNPIGTQNFLIEVEAAPMVRDAAASADDRTLYDQYTDSLEQKFSELSASLNAKADELNKTVEDISALIGASSKPITIYDEDVKVLGEFTVRVRLTYDPVTALVHAVANGEMTITTGNSDEYDLCQIDSKYCPDEDFFTDVSDSDPAYIISNDNLKEIISGDTSKNSNFQQYYIREHDGEYKLRFWLGAGAPDHEGYYKVSLNAVWYARGGKYMGVTPIPIGSNTVTVGTTTTGAPGTQASVTNSGTAKDVVLDFTIPRGADGAAGTGGGDSGHAGTGENSIALGTSATASGKNSIALGTESGAKAKSSIAIGYACTADKDYGVAIGAGTHAGTNGLSIGGASNNTYGYGVAVGYQAVAVENGVAIGFMSCANVYSSVAIGYDSQTHEENTVSVGRAESGLYRRIVNVNDPISAQDAATKAYVDALIAKLKSDNGLK